MHELTLLRDLVVIVAVGVVVVALLRRIGVPPIAGFILAGALLGPRSLGVVHDVHDVEVLAEVGVVLLLFGIGLELSLDRLRRLWREILLGGLLQVGLTGAAATGAAVLFGLPLRQALFVGMLVAVSSTAIVLRGLQARGEVDAPHGKLTLGILVFQDLCVVPMILVVPLLAGSGDAGWGPLLALVKAAAVLVGVVVAARIVVPRALDAVARTRQRDLFVLSVLALCLGTAWAVSLAGISLALGAFLAGLVVAGSEYRHQALADLIPFREVFASLFFVSVGMLLAPADLLGHAPIVAGLLALVLAGKLLVVMLVAALMRLPLRVAVLAGAALAQVGEFSFVLLRAGQETPLASGDAMSYLTATAILSMLVTPLLISAGPHLADGFHRLRSLTRRMGVITAAEAAGAVGPLRDHVIIAGYGLAGEELARSLREAEVPYVVVDLNPANVRRAAAAGNSACYCDATSPELLEHLGADRATELVVVMNDPDAAERVVRTARRMAPDLEILVRARYYADVEPLLRAGASRVVAEELEAAAAVSALVLARHAADSGTIDGQVRRIRERRAPARTP